MYNKPVKGGSLVARAEALLRDARVDVANRTAAVGDARREAHLAATWHLRRAAVPGSIDNRIYAHGSAEQALGGLNICPIAALGFKAAGALLYGQLMSAAERIPEGSLIDHMREVLRDEQVHQYCVELGSYHRFQWKRTVYEHRVAQWSLKPIASDPLAKWRRRTPTWDQRDLFRVIAECLAAQDPSFCLPALKLRGETHDWLKASGGNPMFWYPPKFPAFVRRNKQGLHDD